MYLVDCLAQSDSGNNSFVEAKAGLLFDDLKTKAEFGLFSEVAQFYTLVNDGLILTRHVFKGLVRPLYCDDSLNGDRDKLAYSRKPTYDYEWSGGRDGAPSRKAAPKASVFVVFMSPNSRHQDLYPEVSLWINHWTWIREDQGLAEAPENWVDRFDKKLWSQEKE